jgi:diadenosine tetraphosphate (Ap4A) HIT family hydrolase
MTRTWPEDWESRKQGVGCPFCTDLSSRSFHSGRISEALLERHAIATGHTAVVFRGRHVAALTDLTADELAEYWLDIQEVARAIERVFKPCHVNYQLLGNIVPHLHVHVVPRYLDDSAPQRPLPWNTAPVSEEDFGRRVRELRDAMTSEALRVKEN